MSVTISRLYNSYPDAQAAINRLEAAGVKHGDISVLASNADEWYKEGSTGKPSTFPDRDLDRKDDRAEAAGTGASVGALTGGALGALTGLGLLAIPGVGPVVAAGWLVATVTGAAQGAPRVVCSVRSPTQASARTRRISMPKAFAVEAPSSAHA